MPPTPPKADAAAAKTVGQAEADLLKRLSQLFKGAATKLDGMAKGEAKAALSPEEALALMAKLTGGIHDAPREGPQGQRATGAAKALATGIAAKTLTQTSGPLAGRAIDHAVQQIRPPSAGPNMAPGVPQPTDGGPAGILAPFFRWMPRRKTWRQFKRWLEKKLLKRDLDAASDEAYIIEEEDDENTE